MRRARVLIAASLLSVLALACSHSDEPTDRLVPSRSYRMGFSAIPPTPEFATAMRALEMWTTRADAAIMHLEPPWKGLLDGIPADSLVRADPLGLALYYRAVHLDVVITLDPTNGLDRSAESPTLVALGHSLTEPAVQQLYRNYAVAIDTLIHPSRLGLASETNLIRAAAPPSLYAAVKQVANDAAADVRSHDAAVKLYVSVQVDVAWNRLGAPSGDTPTYGGIAQDIADYPFVQTFAMSAYPYLAGFAEPEDVPLDYYAAIGNESGKPVFVDEGGWTSVSLGPVTSTPAKQARWIRRQSEMLGRAQATAWFQLTFTDFALSVFPPQPPGSILPLFASLGLVDSALTPKAALGPWDSTFARPLSSF